MTTTIQLNNSSTHQPTTAAVQVALRVRPLTEQDRKHSKLSNSTESSNIIKTHENSIAIVPYQKSFQLDYVFDENSTQEQVFQAVASNLIDKFIDGFNVTILAYGQTSSGKTYTMGTAIDDQMGKNTKQEGIIPRAMTALFQRLDTKEHHVSINDRHTPSPLSSTPFNSSLKIPRRSVSVAKMRPKSTIINMDRRGSSTSLPLTGNHIHRNKNRFAIFVSFIEIYNEELVDLLNPAPPNERTPVMIREDTKGHIIWSGIKEVPVDSTEDVLRYLRMGTENRATGSTDMNAKSSRSHAIFSVTLKQEKWVPSNKANNSTPISSSGLNNRHTVNNVKSMVGQMEKQSNEVHHDGEWIVTHSKFHFVDLAGSERLKRTAAEGDRRKEGININAGLLALGNVISALSDPSNKKSIHVPYRDSKLTRLLQDSLGGNSTTLMIACVSPAEINLTETVNTIKYACRARTIRNKVEKNESWMMNDNVDHLRHIILKLKAEIKSLRASSSSSSAIAHYPSPLASSSSSSRGGSTGGSSKSLVSSTISPSSSISDPEPVDLPPSSSLDLTDQHHNETDILVADLRRQIEELQNEVIVTRERNQLVEHELRQKPINTDNDHDDFEHLVEPVIQEYEKSISVLESQLDMTKVALHRSEQMMTEQKAKLVEYETMHTNEIKSLEDLKNQLTEVLFESNHHKAYINKLEEQLKTAQDDQLLLSQLRKKIVWFKEMDEHTEHYMNDLEARLSASENERAELTERIDSLLHLPKHIPQGCNNENEDTLRLELTTCQAKCQQLESELNSIKERRQTEDISVQTEGNDFATISQLTQLMIEKESQIDSLGSHLNEIEKINLELNHLCQTHLQEINRLEETLIHLKSTHETMLSEEQERSHQIQQALTCELQQVHHDHANIQQKEEIAQSTIHAQLKDLKSLKSDLSYLQKVEEKQDAIIQQLEAKLIEMENLTSCLHNQLEEQSHVVELLESDNVKKSDIIIKSQKELEGVLREMRSMDLEKTQLQQVMYFLEQNLKLHNIKSDKALEMVNDIKHQYNIRKEDVKEKRATIDLLEAENKEISKTLKHALQHASQSDKIIESLELELSKTSHKQADIATQLEQEKIQTEYELQQLKQIFEDRIQELDQEVQEYEDEKLKRQQELSQLEQIVQKQLLQNESLIKTIAELENTIKKERTLTSCHDHTGIIVELENKLTALQETKKSDDDFWKAQLEKSKVKLYSSYQAINDLKNTIKTLEKSLEETEGKLSNKCSYTKPYETIAVDVDKEEDLSTENRQPDLKQPPSNHLSYEELLDRIVQLEEDKTQLLKHNDDLESQLVLQRNRLTLETKNLELELLKLTAANDRLEKEMEQVIPRNMTSSSTDPQNRDSANFTSPPQTPRISSSHSTTVNGSIQYILQRDISRSSLAKLSKSGSYRSVSTLVHDSYVSGTTEEDIVKRLSSVSGKSDTTLRSSLRSSSRTHISSTNLPPPTAPPSNPLPPIPTPLPALPPPPPSLPPPSFTSALPYLGYTSELSSDPGSPPLYPTTVSQASLHRNDSTTSTSFSELMNSSNFTTEQYDKLIRSLQRKAQCAENDVRAHQEVITKLETQLSRSESSVREVKKQMDALNREKQVYNLEIQNLRLQVTQFESQQKTFTDESQLKRKDLEEKLKEQIVLKEKAEKARRILENRMEELMNKKSKFMCF